MVSDSDYDLILFCLDKSINYSIGKLFFGNIEKVSCTFLPTEKLIVNNKFF